jgi:hypothetical protein
MQRFRRILVAGVACGLLVAACGDDDDDATDTTEADGGATETTAATETTELDEAAAEEEIRANIDTYFSTMGQVDAAPAEEQDALIEETVSFLESATDENREQIRNFGPLAAGLSVEITEVTFISDTEAEFTFDLLINGNPTQVTGSTGKAVFEDGVWKLSQETWGALAALADSGGGGGDEGEGGGEEETTTTAAN